ncbi:Hsp33 family molecular chaperone HslO [Sporolactobacillus sp. THM7-7]|nr:Hsp33 family molecular chaperone HslO [Sporolactobacillus sp. THM7-7]
MSDYLIKAIAMGERLRVVTAVTTGTVSEAQRRHGTWPTASAALGRTMTASIMMGALLKENQKLTVTIEGGGPIGVIVADADTNGYVRGYVTNPNVHFDLNRYGKLDVARAVGTDGFLSVVKDLGMRENFTGRVPLISGELGDDFTYYFARSEQIPSAVGVGVLVNPNRSIKAAGGFLIQVLPGTDEGTIEEVEKRLNQIPPISRLIDAGRSPEELLDDLFPNEDYKMLEKKPVRFRCTCSKKRFGESISGLPVSELKTMIAEDHGADATCRFCGSTYHFSEEELRDMLIK